MGNQRKPVAGRKPGTGLLKSKVFWTIAGIAAVLLYLNRKTLATWYDLIADYFLQFEGFRSSPYWDVKRWSWGYGTRVPGSVDNPEIRPPGEISRAQALADALAHAGGDFKYLDALISTPLSSRQWAALLDFSYNLGRGNADNLVKNINAGDWDALQEQWLLYNKVDGKYNQRQADRRAFEINEFLADV